MDDGDIVEIVTKKEAQIRRQNRAVLIIQPGAIGDCVQTLPLVEFLKKSLGVGSVRMMGRTDYIDIFCGRTSIDRVRSIDSVDLHKLFVEPNNFELTDDDSLINDFAGCEHIVTFLKDSGGSFEQNLIYTANCSSGCEVTTLKLKPNPDSREPVSNFYIQQFINDNPGLDLSSEFELNRPFIDASQGDIFAGKKLLQSAGCDETKKTAVISVGSGGKHKCWHLDNFYSMADSLVDRDIEVLFLLGPAEMDRLDNRELDRLGVVGRCLWNLTLTEAVQLISCSDCFVGNDSGVTQLAGALGKKTMAIFGPTNAAIYRPLGPSVKTIEFEDYEFSQPSSSATRAVLADVLLFL